MAHNKSSSELEQENARLVTVIRNLLTNPDLNLGDGPLYEVREREGKGWNGPSVIAFGQAIFAAEQVLKDYPQ